MIKPRSNNYVVTVTAGSCIKTPGGSGPELQLFWGKLEFVIKCPSWEIIDTARPFIFILLDDVMPAVYLG